jgi:hypothetical protein
VYSPGRQFVSIQAQKEFQHIVKACLDHRVQCWSKHQSFCRICWVWISDSHHVIYHLQCSGMNHHQLGHFLFILYFNLLNLEWLIGALNQCLLQLFHAAGSLSQRRSRLQIAPS